MNLPHAKVAFHECGRCMHHVVGAIIGLLAVLGADCHAQQWELSDSLDIGRHHFGACDVGNGQILVFGGYTQGSRILGGIPTSRCEIIDAVSGRVRRTGSMYEPRAVMGVLQDDHKNVYAIGGMGPDTASSIVERFNAVTQRWEYIGTLRKPRWQHAVAWLDGRRILVVGGWLERSAEIFDIESGESTFVTDFIAPANSMRGISRRGGPPLFFGYRTSGGSSGSGDRSEAAYIYNETTGVWESKIQFPDAPVAPEVLLSRTGYTVVVGGAIREEPFVAAKGVSLLTDNTTGFVQEIAQLQEGRQHHGVAEYVPGSIVIAGGITDATKPLSSTEWFDIEQRQVRPGMPMRFARCFFRVVAVDVQNETYVFAISGLTSSFQTTASVERIATCRSIDILRSSDSQVRMTGLARWSGNAVRLCDAEPMGAGAVWMAKRGFLGNAFSHEIIARYSNGNDHDEPDGSNPGADGLCFVIQTQGGDAIGVPGRGIGYWGIQDAIAIEHDIYMNPASNDPNGNHLGLQVGGKGKVVESLHELDKPNRISFNIPSIKADGSLFAVRYELRDRRLRVWLTQQGSLGDPSMEVADVNVDSILGLTEQSTYWMGFTAATGKSVSSTDIVRWTENPCVDPQDLPVSVIHNEGVEKERMRLRRKDRDSWTIEIQPLTYDRVIVVYDIRGSSVDAISVAAGVDTIIWGSERLDAGTYFVQDVALGQSALIGVLR